MKGRNIVQLVPSRCCGYLLLSLWGRFMGPGGWLCGRGSPPLIQTVSFVCRLFMVPFLGLRSYPFLSGP